MKKFISLLFTLVLVTGLFTPMSNHTAEAAFSYKKGDILITNETSSKGILGHAAIYVGNGKVLHTSGWKSEPYPKYMTIKDWEGRYKKKVKVLRYKNAKTASKAADQAVKYFKGKKKIPYGFTPAPTNMYKTYCSQLVWYSYYKAGVSYKTWIYNSKQDKHFWQVPSLIKPYQFTDYGNYSKNGFKLVDSKY